MPLLGSKFRTEFDTVFSLLFTELGRWQHPSPQGDSENTAAIQSESLVRPVEVVHHLLLVAVSHGEVHESAQSKFGRLACYFFTP